MASLLIYILKWALALALLYMPFTLLLRKETFASLNRRLLLCAVALSALLPLLVLRFTIEIEQPATANAAQPAITAPTAAMPSSTVNQHVPAATEPSENEQRSTKDIISWENAAILYLIGLAAALLREIAGVIRIRQAIARGTIWRDKRNGITIHCHANATAPFSWFSHVVISQNDYDECGNEILLHEEGHIRHRHSLDMLIIGTVKILQWFNPFIYMLSDDIKEIHEYEADRYVLSHNSDARSYQLLILKKAAGTSTFPLANSFSQSSVRKRITMMARKDSSRSRRARWCYLLPVSACIIGLFAQPEYVYSTNSIEPQQREAEDKAPSMPPSTASAESVSDTPKPPVRHIALTAPCTEIPYHAPSKVELPKEIAFLELPEPKEEKIYADNYYEYIDIGNLPSDEALKCTGIRKCDLKVRFTANTDGHASDIAVGSCNISTKGSTTPTDIEHIKAAAADAAIRHIATKYWETDNKTIYDAYIVFHHGPASSIPSNRSKRELMIGATAIK